MQSQVWEDARKERKQVLDWLSKQKIELDRNPAANIGGLNEKIASLREMSNKVRDEVFNAQAVMIALKRERDTTSDSYEQALSDALEAASTLPDDLLKKLPRSQEERERHFRRGFLSTYNDKLTAERHVEEWEHYQKMLYTIYYSLKDSNDNILTQLSVIKQQYFSGELELNEKATSLANFLSDDAKKLLSESPARFGEVDFDTQSRTMEGSWESATP